MSMSGTDFAGPVCDCLHARLASVLVDCVTTSYTKATYDLAKRITKSYKELQRVTQRVTKSYKDLAKSYKKLTKS